MILSLVGVKDLNLARLRCTWNGKGRLLSGSCRLVLGEIDVYKRQGIDYGLVVVLPTESYSAAQNWLSALVKMCIRDSLTIVTTYQEIDVALVVINLPIAAYQPSSPWLLGLFKGINWEGKTPIIDGSYSDPDQKFSFKLPDGVHFLYAFEKDFYFNQPYRFLPEADGMVGLSLIHISPPI